jgi:uncharacterized protein DUF6049
VAPAAAAAVMAVMTALAWVLPAAAATGARGAAGRGGSGYAAQPQPAALVAITSVSPRVAKPGSTVTVTGVVTNRTAAPMSGLSVQLWSSGTYLPNRTALTSYLTTQGPTGADSPQGLPQALPALPSRASQHFTMRLRATQTGMRYFGVYPLAVQLSNALGPLDAARTLLPFWPGKAEARVARPLNIAWVWPLIGTPQRAACQALLGNSLAASVAPGGRLDTLLTQGQTAQARQARLTWAIDPALLSDVTAMTRRYVVGASDTCTGGTPEPASRAAATWLNGVKSVAAQQDYFVTPYADVDVAALAHRGPDGQLAGAFGEGRSVAHKILGHDQHTAGRSAGAMAWPADGIADYTVLEGLAASKVSTVILDSTMMPPQVPVTYTPSAVTTTSNGLGTQPLHILLADHTLTRILSMSRTEVPGIFPPPAGPGAGAGLTQAAAFGQEQWFLAETAMISAEAPQTGRAVVVAPPRRWDPPAGMPATLLTETLHAPWLHPASLASLVTSHTTPGSVARRQPPELKVSKDELHAGLLRQVRKLSVQIRLLGSILTTSGHGYLSTALAAMESSAWRGGRKDQRGAEKLAHQVSAYVTSQLSKVRIVDPLHVTLGGKSGSVPVSVSNKLDREVTVRLEVSAASSGRVVIGHYPQLITVAARTLRTIKIPVQAAVAGSTTLTLTLATPQGRALPSQPATLTVEATHFGTLAIVLIVVALVVFVLTAVGRALRRGGGPGGEGGDDGEAAEGGEAGDNPATPQSLPDPAFGGGEADNVVATGADDPHRTEEADDHASAPGQAHR